MTDRPQRRESGGVTPDDARAICPVCSSTRVQQRYRLPMARLDQCLGCGFVFYHGEELHRAIEERYASFEYSRDPYFAHCRSDPSRNLIVPDFRRILTEIHSYLRPPGRLLDVGSGTGLFLNMAHAAGWETVGVEPNTELARSAREQFSLDIRDGSLQNLVAQRPGPFNAITLLDVLEHLPDPYGHLSQAVELLAPGGLLAVAVPNIRSPINWIAHAMYRLSACRIIWPILKLYSYPDHVNYFDPRTLSFLVERAGLRIVYSRSYSRSHEVLLVGAPVQLLVRGVLHLSEIMGLGNKLFIIANRGA